MTKQRILHVLSANRALLDKFNVSHIYLFGSHVRNQANPSSDVDLFVEFHEPISIFQFLDLKEALEEKLGQRVDLATKDSLHPALKDDILKEAMRAA